MRYKTKGNISPQGLPKVYVTGHSAGFDAYLEEIKEDLLKFSNCAVFFDPIPEQPENMETFFDDLESMQLIVLVVTADFVEQDTFAFSHVFKFAQDHTIPVLPIQEGIGIEEAFNAKCGDLQMLNPHSQDITEISYEEKLKKFLDSKLIGDEMIKKIREAFDAYVFLSYRKKDREYAQKLMRLIHSSDFCRDIAIWYDEFLVPGENFNKAIEDAMKKSKLFALAVTPHLLEEGNYVMTTEYPAANAKDPVTREPIMKVMPVELVETDKQALQEKYEDIPLPISANDPERISETIRQALGLESTENNDPQHLLFIGLAYLSGIDVEVDRERAAKIITAAAEQDLPEAVDKLVSMYHDGNGVKRDYHTAIQWQKRLVELREKQYRQTGEESDARQWMLDFRQWGNYKREELHFDDALKIYNNELAVLDELMTSFDDIWFKRHLAYICNDIGDMYKINGRRPRGIGSLQNSKTYYEKAHAILKELAVQSDSVEAQIDLSASYSNLGDISKAQDDLVSAENWYKKALTIIETLAVKSNKIEVQRTLYFYYDSLGEICYKQGNIADAKAWYEKSMAVREELAEKNVPNEAKTDLFFLVHAYNKYSKLNLTQSDLNSIRAWHEKIFAISTKLAAALKCCDWILASIIVGSYDKLVDICKSQGNLVGAKALHTKMLTFTEVLKSQSNTVQMQRELLYLYSKLYYNSKANDDLVAAEEWHEQVLAIVENLKAQKDSASAQMLLSDYYASKGDICTALEIREKLAEEDDSVEVQSDIAKFYIGHGNTCYREHNDLVGAKGWFEKALTVYEKLAALNDSFHVRIDLALSYDKLIRICEKLGELETAKELCKKVIPIREKLAAESDSAAAQRQYAACYWNLGKICKAQGDLADAEEYYAKAREIKEKLEAKK